MGFGKNIILSDNHGCNFVLNLDAKRKNTKINLLQLTDVQFIDSAQRRYSDRLHATEINAWAPQKFDALCKNHIRSLVTQTNPDLIFITGDLVYGSFDDSGTMLCEFCKFMDSLNVPWAPTFGNHDNESKKGVKWQCEQFEKSEYCIFNRGTVSGNSNYSVGIAIGGELVRVLYMLDSNGCAGSDDNEVIKEANIFPDQLEFVEETAMQIEKKCGKKIPAFMAFHIPVQEFGDAEINTGYKTDTRDMYTIGVDVPGKNHDFGCKLEPFDYLIKTETNFIDLIKRCNVEAVFAGHFHNINTVIEYEGIKWVFGLKTGQYDYHVPGQLGGTKICIDREGFEIGHVPALVQYAPFPKGGRAYENFFAEDRFIVEI